MSFIHRFSVGETLTVCSSSLSIVDARIAINLANSSARSRSVGEIKLLWLSQSATTPSVALICASESVTPSSRLFRGVLGSPRPALVRLPEPTKYVSSTKNAFAWRSERCRSSTSASRNFLKPSTLRYLLSIPPGERFVTRVHLALLFIAISESAMATELLINGLNKVTLLFAALRASKSGPYVLVRIACSMSDSISLAGRTW